MGREIGEWCRCRSLSLTPPASLHSHGSRAHPTLHIPPSPLAGRGYPRDCALLHPSSRGARQGGIGVLGGKDRRGVRKGDGSMRSDRGERKKNQPGSRTHCRVVLNQLRGSHSRCHAMVLDIFGGWPMLLRLLADDNGSSGRGQPAMSPQFPDPPQTWWMAAGSGPLANGTDSSAPSRTAAIPPRPRSMPASLLSHLFFFCSSTTASAAPGDLRFSVLPDLLSTAIPLSSEGSLTAYPSFLPGFGTNVTQFIDREEGGGNQRTFTRL